PGTSRAAAAAAAYAAVDVAGRRRRRRLTALGCAGDRRWLAEPRPEPRRVEAQETLRPAQPRHCHQDDLALAQRTQPAGALGRVGIALETLSRFPLGQGGDTSGGRLGAAEVRNARGQREGDPPGASALE